jgi:folate-binding protein YgfZ
VKLRAPPTINHPVLPSNPPSGGEGESMIAVIIQASASVLTRQRVAKAVGDSHGDTVKICHGQQCVIRRQRRDTEVMDTSWLGDVRDGHDRGPDAATCLQSQTSQNLREMVVGDGVGPSSTTDRQGRRTSRDDGWRRDLRLDTDPGFGPVLDSRLNRVASRRRCRRPIDGEPWTRTNASPQHGRRWVQRSSAEIPAETGLDDVAISFTKGCYPGQELVERMDSRGSTAPRHLTVLPRHTDDVPGVAVVRQAAPIGTITSVGTTQVLAYVKRGHDGAARD